MKRIATATVIICFIAVLPVMGQTTSTTTSTSTSKPATQPTSSSAAKPTSKTSTKPAITWDGVGKWQRQEGEAQAEKTGAGSTDKWPSSTYETPASAQPGGERYATVQSGAMLQGSNYLLRCRGPEGRPCTQWEVREMSRRMVEKSAEHPALASIRSLTLVSSEGGFSCRQFAGAPCTHEQLRALNEHVAEPLRCVIYDMRPNSANPNSMERTQTPMTMGNRSTTANSATRTGWSTATTPSRATTTPSSTSTTPSINSSTLNHNSTAQNHASITAVRATAPPHHTSTTSKQNSTPPKQP